MQRPDIVFIVLDTQRADRLGCYGYPRPISRNLDAFAERSILFTQAVAPAQWTIPSHGSMFTGLYPTAHQLVQSNRTLGPDRPLMAEVLHETGYETVGFCNNPLVGILNNGLTRGFQTFYNYGGAIPTVPQSSSRFPWPFNRLAASYTQFLRRISYPIQNYFGKSDLAFSISLNAWLTPLWSRLANFKGQNERSVHDVSHFLRQRSGDDAPLFLFLNLMETHLPFTPPQRFVDRWAPGMATKAGQRLMRAWNRESYRWGAPIVEPMADGESQLLNDMYDAEVAYQDDYLGPLLEQLALRDNTLVVIASDHGDGLGDHGYMGHAFVAYEELVRVPLFLRWPARWSQPAQVTTPISTRRVFHTILDAARVPHGVSGLDRNEVSDLSLAHTIAGQDPEQGTAYAEVYPPNNFVRAVSDRLPGVIESHRCLAMRRAVVCNGWKLIDVDKEPEELYELRLDPSETDNQVQNRPAVTAELETSLNRLVERVEKQRERLRVGSTFDVASDDQLLRRMKGLGYIE